MSSALSLRLRLTVIILVPLIGVAVAVGYWQLQTARQTAQGVFERALLTVALAVANDVAVSEGDALSRETLDLLSDSSGGPVFYHVYAPDGVIVAGYATPPVGIPRQTAPLPQPLTFEARYLGRPVSGVRLQTQTQIEGFAGIFTTTVWQDRAVRDGFVQDLLRRNLAALSAVLAALLLIVWFGVRLGLRPLLDLEAAIRRRSSDELSPIRRPVPVEVAGVVETLNGLFAQVSSTLDAQSQFIANAAHQLRNPIAGVLALAEAVDRAKTPADIASRTADLLEAAQNTAHLTERLLLHERARAISPETSFATIDLGPWLRGFADGAAAGLPAPLVLRTDIEGATGPLVADALMLGEALSNLIDNAQRHGGPNLTEIALLALPGPGPTLRLVVEDNGRGIPEAARATALRRFSQIDPNTGSGLGLAIAEAIARAHGGALRLEAAASGGLRAEFTLPRRTPSHTG
ncbi:MAG: sensor histidine kinase [Pseudomonadota bacterium]